MNQSDGRNDQPDDNVNHDIDLKLNVNNSGMYFVSNYS